jgi:hypothetical protein
MENDKKKEKDGEESCCSSGHGCGGCGGCGCRAILAVLLLLVGGLIGYVMGTHCGMHRYMSCPMGMSIPAPVK